MATHRRSDVPRVQRRRPSLKVPVSVEHRLQRDRDTIRKANMNLHPIAVTKSLVNVFRVVFFSLATALSLGSFQPVAADEGYADKAQRNSLTGNWYVTVRVDPGQAPITALQTYFEDGNMIEETNSTAIRSLGHGSWKPIGHRQFRRTFLIFSFDASRNFTGRAERTHTLELSHDGRFFANLGGAINRYDREGNLLSSQTTGPGEVGVRFREELPIVPGQ